MIRKPRGTVYFIGDGQHIKIGFSVDPVKRLQNLKSGSPRPLTEIGQVAGHRRHEMALHQLLHEQRCGGEWFEDCARVREVINEVLATGWESIEVAPEIVVNLDPYVREGIELANIITKYHEGEALGAIGRLYGMESNLLWTLKYRPPSELTAGSYFKLIDAAHRALDFAQRQLSEDRAAVDEIEKPHLDRAAATETIEKELARLESVLAGGAAVSAAEALVGETPKVGRGK